MFRKVMYSDEDLCIRVIELLLDVSIDHISYKDQEHGISTTSDQKSVRLDVYVNDVGGTVFDLEMQNLNEICLPRRTRFYQSMIDVESLAKGVLYDKLPDSYIV